MSNESIVSKLAASGLIPEDMLQQFYKWKMLTTHAAADDTNTAQDIVETVIGILDTEGMTLIRETDLNIVRQYLSTQNIGQLVIKEGDSGEQTTVVDVSFGRTLLGEVVIPWRGGDQVLDLITNGHTYLSTVVGEHLQFTYFSNAKSAYFGDMQAFILCQPSSVEDH